MNEQAGYVIYRGRKMPEGWPEKIAEAQKSTHVFIGGVAHERIKYGNEEWEWKRPDCHDCGVHMGEYHVAGCDAEQCPVCGDQAFACDCVMDPRH